MSIPMNRDSCRSDEEWQMVLWLQEAVRFNLVEAWSYEPQTFELFPKQTYIEEIAMKTMFKHKRVERSLHRSESYTPDFNMMLTTLGKKLLYSAFKPSLLASYRGDCGEVWIDVKGKCNPYQNDQRYFSITRKAMFQAHRIWTAKVIPFYKVKGVAHGLFKETFSPDCLRYMKKGGVLNAIGRDCISAEEFVRVQIK